MDLNELQLILEEAQKEVASMMESKTYPEWDKDEKWQFMLHLEEKLSEMPWAIELPFEPGFTEKGFPESIKTPQEMAEHLLYLLKDSKMRNPK